MFTFKGKFRDYTNCTIEVAEYCNGNTAMRILNDEGVVGVCTVNTGLEVPSNCVVIKNYTENEGMDKALLELGLLGEKLYDVPCGLVSVPVYMLADDFDEVVKRLNS